MRIHDHDPAHVGGPRQKRKFHGRSVVLAGIAMVLALAIVPVVAAAQDSPPELYARNADNDIDVTPDGAGASNPRGLWGDGTTIWVSSTSSQKIFAFDLAAGDTFGTRVTGKDIATGNSGPTIQGLWSDGTTMWVLRSARDAAGGPLADGGKIEAYALAGGTRDAAKDISLDSDSLDPAGLWSDGTTMWTADSDDDKLYAYTLSDGQRDVSNDFDLASGNTAPQGLWSDDTTIWVSDSQDRKLYAYTLSDGTRDTNQEFSTAVAGSDWSQTGAPRGLWSDGTTMWVADLSRNVLYAFNMTGTSLGGL